MEELLKALEEIANFDASSRMGCLDEWEEAWAFTECQNIARNALERANTACTPTNGGLAQADNQSTPAAIRG